MQTDYVRKWLTVGTIVSFWFWVVFIVPVWVQRVAGGTWALQVVGETGWWIWSLALLWVLLIGVLEGWALLAQNDNAWRVVRLGLWTLLACLLVVLHVVRCGLWGTAIMSMPSSTGDGERSCDRVNVSSQDAMGNGFEMVSR